MDFEERIFELMMEALDGELSEADYLELGGFLADNPELAVEWQMMQRIDTLFHATPMLMPESSFAQQTLARLPNQQVRKWLMIGLFGLLFVAGVLPLAGILVANNGFPIPLVQPTLLGGLGQSILALFSIFAVVLQGAWQLLGAGIFVGVREPTVWGTFLLMTGFIVLWGGVYSQFIRQPRLVYVSTRSS